MTTDPTPDEGTSDVVAAHVMALRRAKGMNREALGAQAGLSPAALTNLETGRRDKTGRRRRHVTVDELVALSDALEVPWSVLMSPDATVTLR